MLTTELRSFGKPSEVVALVEAADPPPPGPGDVAVDILAAPINPADLLLIEGRYASRPQLPAPLGIEGAGRIAAVGEGVDGLAPGDPVVSLGRANWLQRLVLPAGAVVKLPPGIDLEQAAMLKVNPATAKLMLTGYVTPQAGDWVIQNAANSGVGRAIIQLAGDYGWRSVGVVRRPELVGELTALGADAVVLDGKGLAARVAEATGDGPVRLAIDAVGGPATARLATCLADGGTVVNYGLLSGEPCQMPAESLVFRGATLTGFWLAQRMRGMAADDLAGLYGDLIARIADGRLSVPVAARYPLSRIGEALDHAGRYGRSGKVLLTPGDA